MKTICSFLKVIFALGIASVFTWGGTAEAQGIYGIIGSSQVQGSWSTYVGNPSNGNFLYMPPSRYLPVGYAWAFAISFQADSGFSGTRPYYLQIDQQPGGGFSPGFFNGLNFVLISYSADHNLTQYQTTVENVGIQPPDTDSISSRLMYIQCYWNNGIIYDTPIGSPYAYYLVVDATPPLCTLNSLPPQTDNTTFTVSWSGLDNPGASGHASGISSYAVQYKDGSSGTWQAWYSGTASSQSFTGTRGHTYYFQARSYDNVGWSSSWSPSYTYILQHYTLTINQATGGTITPSPSPGSDGKYAEGTVVTVSESQTSCYTFGSWTSAASGTASSANVTMDSDKTVSATFNQISYTISTSSSTSAGGSTGGGGSKVCGSLATVTATPNSGYGFVKWTENGSQVSTLQSYQFTVGANRTLMANFADTATPTVTIISPTSSTTYSTNISTMSLGGTASDNVGVTQVTWSNDRGGSGAASGTTSWSVSSISLQDGVNVITVTAYDSAGNTSIDTLTVTYTPPTAPSITTTSPLPASTVNSVYSQTLAASGGTTPYTWALASGSLPTGLNINTGGVISGTPSVAATANFSIKVTGSDGLSSTNSFSLTINAAAVAPTITTTNPLPAGTVNTAYNQTFAATGGTTPYTWAVASGSLPTGLNLSTGGVISGTPSAAATANFSIKVTGNNGLSSTNAFSLTINAAAVAPAITTTSPLPAGTVNTAYNQTLAATGGTTPYTWAVASGSLPTGLSLSTVGVISGTPSVAATASFSIKVTGNNGLASTNPFSLTINAASLAPTITTTSPLPGGITNISYSQTFSATGGTTPYTWALASGSLPAGLSLTTGGVLSGTPNSVGTSSFSVKVTGNNGLASTNAFSLAISGQAALRQLSNIAISNGVIRFVLNGQVGSNYVIQVSTNLQTWQPFSLNVIPTGGTNLIPDLDALKDSRRFYRAIATNAILLSSNASPIWKGLPGRANNNGQIFFIPPTFQPGSVDWTIPVPADWNRGDTAAKPTFFADNLRFDFEFLWTGGGTIELFICNADDLTETNWVPNTYYRVYISTADTAYLETDGYDNGDIFQNPGIETSDNYQNAWVTISVVKTGGTWSFYRNGGLLDTQTFNGLNGKRMALIVAPSNNWYKYPDLNVSFRKIQVSVP